MLAATPFARRDLWASRAAVLIAQDWARDGLRIFLMDLGLEEPTLHEVLDLPNGEGVSDAFLFGASIQHIAKPALGNAVFFASAGAPPGDTEEVLGHPRWNDLAGGFSEAEATLLLYLPTEIPGADKILSRATEILFLAARSESAEDHLGPASIKVVTSMGPLGTPPAEPSSAPRAVGEGEGPPGSEPPVPDEGDLEPPEDASEDLFLGFVSKGEPSDLDFAGGLELAEGFGPEEPGGEPPKEPSAEPPAGILPEAGGVPMDDGSVPAQDVPVAVPQAEADGADSSAPEQPESDKAPSDEFGDDLVVGSAVSESSLSSADEVEEEEEVKSAAPDFEPDFVDLPPAGAVGEPETPSGGFPDDLDLVQGPDFGAPLEPDWQRSTPETDVRGEEPPPPVPPVPRPEPREAVTAPPERRRPPRKKPPKKKMPWGWILVVLLAVGFLGAAVGTALGYLDVPGFTQLRGLFSEIPDPPLSLAGPQANEDVLRYSLVLFTYGEGELQSAEQMLDALKERLPDLLLTIVLGESGGEPSYTLLAGPAVDRVEAENLRGPIGQILTREDPASWSVRETPRAFYLGERGTLREAQDYLESVTRGGIHAYILHVTFPEPEGSESYQILTGAFAGVQDARPLQLTLRELGFRDAPLIERRGRLPE